MAVKELSVNDKYKMFNRKLMKIFSLLSNFATDTDVTSLSFSRKHLSIQNFEGKSTYGCINKPSTVGRPFLQASVVRIDSKTDPVNK